MAEFDTRVKLAGRKELELPSGGENFEKELSDVLAKHCKSMGSGGPGEIWLDLSDTFYSRYVVCSYGEPVDGIRRVRLRSGCAPGRIGEVGIVLLILCSFWRLSYCLRPDARTLDIVVATAGFLLALAIRLFALKDRGEAVCDALEAELKEKKWSDNK